MNPQAKEFTTTCTSQYTDVHKLVLLQTAKAKVFNPHTSQPVITVRVLFDSGSQRSYITNKLKDALRLQPEQKQGMSIKTFGTDTARVHICEIVEVGMKMDDDTVMTLTLLAVPLICDPLSAQPIELCQEKYSHLAELQLADTSDGNDHMEVDILLGSDYYWQFMSDNTLRAENGPTAIYTKLGWVLSGPVPLLAVTTNFIETYTLRVDTQLDDKLKKFWDLETLGITDNDESLHNELDIHYKYGRYEVSLPWKEPYPTLPSNYDLSLKRLKGQLYRLH